MERHNKPRATAKKRGAWVKTFAPNKRND